MKFSFFHRQKSYGFSLFELMIAIAIMAILAAAGVPVYHNYIQKAALIDVLRFLSPYKTNLELCLLDAPNLTACDNTLPTSRNISRYVTPPEIKSGVISLKGRRALDGLVITLTPEIYPVEGELTWKVSCHTDPKNIGLEKNCSSLFFSEQERVH